MLCWRQGSMLATRQCNNGALPTDERDDLCCGSKCNDQLSVSESEYNKCCTCNSYTTLAGTERKLEIEYFSVTGQVFVIAENAFDNSDVYKIEQTNGYMTDIPSNLCNWDHYSNWLDIYDSDLFNMTMFWSNIVNINLKRNKIRHLPDINCLRNLDTIDLSFNALTLLRNNSINLLTKLRNLDLSFNSIKDMDPYVLSQPTLSILNANLNNNNIEHLDVTNCFSLKPFCYINYNSNTINSFVNQDNFTLNSSMQYGPGMVGLQDTNLQQWPDLVDLLNLDSLTQLGQLIQFGFDLRGIKLKCDCYLAEFSDLMEDLQKSLWLEYFEVLCTSPQHLEGRLAYLVKPYELVCNLTLSEGCPKGCSCVDQPSNNTVFVDCSNLKLDRMPIQLPYSHFSKYIELNVSQNEIRRISNATYLTSLTVLDISNNLLDIVQYYTVGLLANATLNISYNKQLRMIPKSFQSWDICDINMDYLEFDCNCTMAWIDTWLKHKYCEQAKLFTCLVPHYGLKNATEFRSNMLADCELRKTVFFIWYFIIISTTIFLAISAVVVYKLWYEILIICLRIRRSPIVRHTEFDYDAVITFNEEDDGLRKWVATVLAPELSRDGYSVFLPYKDIMYGTERDGEIISVFDKSKTFILVLSKSYFIDIENSDRSWTENEWKYAWNQFKSNPMKNIVVINYDYISSFEVPQRQISAFLRVGNVVQFGNHDNNIVSEVKIHIGPPITQNNIGLENKKPPKSIVQYNIGIENKKPVFKDHFSFPTLTIIKNQKVVPYHELSENESEYAESSVGSLNDIFLASSMKEENINAKHLSMPFNICPRRKATEKPKFVRKCCSHKHTDFESQNHTKTLNIHK